MPRKSADLRSRREKMMNALAPEPDWGNLQSFPEGATDSTWTESGVREKNEAPETQRSPEAMSEPEMKIVVGDKQRKAGIEVKHALSVRGDRGRQAPPIDIEIKKR